MLTSVNTHRQSEPTLRTIEGVVRMAHKYEMQTYLLWAAERLHATFPNAFKGPAHVYEHKMWEAYEDPTFAFRVVAMCESLPMARQELKGTTGLAFYALTIVDWKQWSQSSVFKAVDPEIIDRLSEGQQELRDIGQILVTQVIDRFRHHTTDCFNAIVHPLIKATAGDLVYALWEAQGRADMCRCGELKVCNIAAFASGILNCTTSFLLK